jgi:hypothetical protein
MAALPIDFREFTFIDLGSGKGRTLLMASEYPFRRIVGVEILPELHRAAEENIKAYESPMRQSKQIECMCADATEFKLTNEALVLYVFNPLPASGFDRVLANLHQSLMRYPRKAYLIYHNPILESLLKHTWLQPIQKINQFVVLRSQIE